MACMSRRLRAFFRILPVLCTLVLVSDFHAFAAEMSDQQIAADILKENNKVIIDEFLKYELREVNEYATKPLLKAHPSLVFFQKQAERSPLSSLLFLEQQVHKLRDAQKNIDSLPYSIAFSSGEKKKVLGLKPSADKIVSYGIPLMKRDFHRVLTASKELADKKKKHPMELIPDPNFRDAIYRRAEITAQDLDTEMGKLSEGELICMRLGWVLEEVTVTRLWLVFNDNKLPDKDDYMAYRQKRSEYFQKRLKRIYGENASDKSIPKKKASK
ncbi:MAG: hypothetical protein HY912_23005 [Desulfomonile tiedjei]|uniref:PpiC domain-containing protein n=1 Tax=Desulfomonile tiedjei TaxID=2358 RepID=A0A9D6Z5Q4_9BACT|nr:hypothetical protein [Desulfomonile tiedjei]